MGRTGIFGGTFDYLHDGHKALLHTAFQNGEAVIIGITSNEKANSARERTVSDFETRKENVREECLTLQNIYNATFELVKIKDGFELATTSEADFIVLSPEKKTHERALKINNAREENGLNRLQIIEAPMVESDVSDKISSTDISNDLIDIHGHKK